MRTLFGRAAIWRSVHHPVLITTGCDTFEKRYRYRTAIDLELEIADRETVNKPALPITDYYGSLNEFRINTNDVLRC